MPDSPMSDKTMTDPQCAKCGHLANEHEDDEGYADVCYCGTGGPVCANTARDVYRYALAIAQRDSARLDWLADEPIFDGLGKLDLHETACDIAGGSEVSPEKMRDCYRKAIRILIDAAASISEEGA